MKENDLGSRGINENGQKEDQQRDGRGQRGGGSCERQ